MLHKNTIISHSSLSSMEEYQELVRKLAIAGCSPEDKAFYNGWTQVAAIKMVYSQFKDQLNHEQQQIAEKAIEKLNHYDPDGNVRAEVKAFLRYPYYPEYPPWEKYDDPELLALCKTMSNKPHKLQVYNGKLYLMLGDAIPQELKDLSNNTEEPHITIINSDVFDKDKHGKYDGVEVTDVVYTHLESTECLDWPPFKNCVVVKCQSNYIKEQFGKKGLHYTVKITPREPFKFV